MDIGPITLIIIAGTSLFSFQAFSNHDLFNKYLLNPYMARSAKQYYRYVTHAFLHSDQMHLIINMYVLYMFGSSLEQTLVYKYGLVGGSMAYLMVYAGGLLFSTVPSIQKHSNNPGYNAVGASGAVSAVMFAFIVFYPTAKLLFFFILPMPAFVAAFAILMYEYIMDKRGRTRIAHDAHLWGALFGFGIIFIIEPSLFPRFFEEIGYWARSLF